MLKVNGCKVEVGHFPDGTILMKNDFVKSLDKNNCIEIYWKFENNEETLSLIYLTKYLKSNGITNISLDMPYIPNARQDRIKNIEDVFTLKFFAEIINSLNFTYVKVLDPHSAVSEGLIDRIIVETPAKNIDKVLEKIGCENLIMFYPDEGAMKRYSSMSKLPYTFGIKKRDWQTGKIMGLDVSGEVQLIKNSRILIIDDICSRGGTFYFSAKRLKELGANEIYLYISHCENTILQGEVLTSGLIEKVFTTDSLITVEHNRIEVL